MKNLTKFYILILVTVSLLLCISTFISISMLNHGDEDYYIINQSGKQRMLGQKVVKCLLIINSTDNKQEISQRTKEVKDAILEYEKIDKLIAQSNILQGVTDINEINKIDSINNKIRELKNNSLSKVYGFIDMYNIDSYNYKKNLAEIINQLLIDEVIFLKLNEDITSFFEEKAENHNHNIIIWILVLCALTLIILFIQALFIFRPAMKTLKNSYDKLIVTKQDLQDSVNIKNKFFSIIAHDLKNPFGVIITSSSTLLRKRGIYSDDKVFEYINMINSSSQIVNELLDNLLLWSRTQSKKIIPYFDNVNINLIVKENVDLLKNVSDTKNIKLINLIVDDLYCTADYNMTKTVIRNLLSNAIKFTQINGEIKIDFKRIEDKIEICISDNGVGIKPDDLKKICNIKYSYHTNGTNGEQGTGLGLVLCKDFIELNNGKFEINSTFGKGTSVSFTLTSSDINTMYSSGNELLEVADTECPILNYFKNELTPLWKDLSVRQSVDKLEKFGNLLVNLGLQHDLEKIKQYGNDILNAKNDFDIEIILNLINLYPQIVESVKNKQINDFEN